jgi:hypothetical protein
VGPRAGLDTVENRKIWACWESNLGCPAHKKGKTDCVGTSCANRKNVPHTVKNKKLKKNTEVNAQEMWQCLCGKTRTE